MYITDRYLCFHSRIISYVTKHVHPWEQIHRVTKERVAFIFPTAIGIRLRTTDKRLVYASFLQRDQAYEKICSLWSTHNSDSSSLINDQADIDDDQHRSKSKARLSQHNGIDKRIKSNDTIDVNNVLQLCLSNDNATQEHKVKRRVTSIVSRPNLDKQTDVLINTAAWTRTTLEQDDISNNMEQTSKSSSWFFPKFISVWQHVCVSIIV
jgi:hypothetical protein